VPDEASFKPPDLAGDAVIAPVMRRPRGDGREGPGLGPDATAQIQDAVIPGNGAVTMTAGVVEAVAFPAGPLPAVLIQAIAVPLTARANKNRHAQRVRSQRDGLAADKNSALSRGDLVPYGAPLRRR